VSQHVVGHFRLRGSLRPNWIELRERRRIWRGREERTEERTEERVKGSGGRPG
jgi:hypothetical protein